MDQVVLRRDADNLSGTTGFGSVAWSIRPDEADGFFRRFGPLLRATGGAARPGLVRLEHRGRTVLLRRVPWRDPGGRASTVCHALMGSSDILDAETCLGLHAWSWSQDGPPMEEARGRLDQVRASTLIASALDGQPALTAGLPAAELLLHPERRMSLLEPEGGAGAYCSGPKAPLRALRRTERRDPLRECRLALPVGRPPLRERSAGQQPTRNAAAEAEHGTGSRIQGDGPPDSGSGAAGPAGGRLARAVESVVRATAAPAPAPGRPRTRPRIRTAMLAPAPAPA
ncbi:hypothetical protein J7E89_05435, partial [Streptomyces sp. ISL-100]|nr:hypothetical protein [Streptomyces sp. ISL-100]